MRPIVRVALFAAGALALARIAERYAPAEAYATMLPAPVAAPSSEPVALCPADLLPDHGVCVPTHAAGAIGAEQEPELLQNAHHDRAGRLVRYDYIPRRPERAKDYRSYHLPIAVPPDRPFVGSDYDLGESDVDQRRGFALKAVGHGGVDWAAPRGTPVHAIQLEHQVGETEILFVGELFGNSVVTLHHVLEAGSPHDYLIIHGHLERAASDLRAGDAAAAGRTLGFVGDSGSAGMVHLHFELRRVRDGVLLRTLGPREWLLNSKSVASDPRNLLHPL